MKYEKPLCSLLNCLRVAASGGFLLIVSQGLLKGQCHLFLVSLKIAKKRIYFNGIVKIMVQIFLAITLLVAFGCGWLGWNWIAAFFQVLPVYFSEVGKN